MEKGETEETLPLQVGALLRVAPGRQFAVPMSIPLFIVLR